MPIYTLINYGGILQPFLNPTKTENYFLAHSYPDTPNIYVKTLHRFQQVSSDSIYLVSATLHADKCRKPLQIRKRQQYIFPIG